MAIELKSTKDAAVDQGVKILVHGPAGSGKTTLIHTLPNPVIISAEAGLLSLKEFDIPAISVGTMEDLWEVYQYLTEGEGQQFDSIAIDSISEVAEVCLAAEKEIAKDPRQAYGAMIHRMTQLVRAFRDIPKNLYMSAKQAREKDELGGAMLYSASMPGKMLGNEMPYMFDEVFALRVEKDDDGNPVRWLQTDRDAQFEAKDRSGVLEQFEQADLGQIINKIIGEK